jgi:hypothetical protein
VNKYALTLPLVMLSFLLGYFGANLKIEHFLVLLVFAALAIAAGAYVLSNKQQKGENRN